MKQLDILVVEDTEKHQRAAEQMLEGHNVTVVDAFDYAIDCLGVVYGKESMHFDVVLSDLLLPQGRGDMQGSEGRRLAYDPMAFGFPIALIAAKQGVPRIALVTDMNHHSHPMAYTFDFFKNESHKPMVMRIQDSICMMFDVRNLSPAFLLQDGSLTVQSPYDLPEDQQENYVSVGEWGFETAKNWKEALNNVLNVKL